MTGNTIARRSPLYERHLALGAKMADFGGWTMPIEYANGGVLAEHAAVREAVGVFDVSHLGKAVVQGTAADGETARHFVDRCLTNDLSRIQAGRAQYTLCCDDRSGGTIDDLIVYLVSDTEVFLVPNAANTADVVGRLMSAAPSGITVTGQHEQFGVLAVQGPGSPEVLTRLGLLPEGELGYMSWFDGEFAGLPVRVCRTGYSGEHGYEVLPRWDHCGELWDALATAVTDFGGRPAGLGARDTLRTEMGYPLHGHELSAQITPLQARAGWAVGWNKPQFWGRSELLAEREAGPARLLRGLEVPGRGIPRAGMSVLDAGGEPVGLVTSGTFSPTLRRGIGLALVDSSAGLAPGDPVVLDVRGRHTSAVLAAVPFVPSHVR